MKEAHLLKRARRAARLSQEDLADRAGTSRPTLSAYENGRKSPSLATASRILAESGFELELSPVVTFHSVAGAHGREYFVPSRLWRLPIEQALETVVLPLRLNWSATGREFRLSRRSERARVYEIVLREGTSDDIGHYVDGALLVDLWPDLVLPRDVRDAWTPLIDTICASAGVRDESSA